MKTETTKILLVLSWAVTLIFSALAALFPVYGLSADGVGIIVPLAWAEVTALNGFYVWKAKNENRAKYAQRFIAEIAEKYGIESAALIAETVLKD
jgi:hypothetical protein